MNETEAANRVIDYLRRCGHLEIESLIWRLRGSPRLLALRDGIENAIRVQEEE